MASKQHSEHLKAEIVTPKEKTSFDLATIFDNKQFTDFADKYAVANSLDKAKLSQDSHELKKVWERFQVKEQAVKELTAFYTDVVMADLQFDPRQHTESSQVLAGVDVYISSLACQSDLDRGAKAHQRMAALREIKSQTGVWQKQKINSLGLAAEYILPDGQVDRPRLGIDEIKYALLEEQDNLKKRIAAAPEFPPPIAEKRALVEVEKKMRKFNIPIEAPRDELQEVLQNIKTFKIREQEVEATKKILKKQLEFHADGEKNSVIELVKARERLAALEKIVGSGSRREKIKQIESLGMQDRYVRGRVNFELTDKIQEEILKQDIAALKAALAEASDNPVGDLRVKKEDLHRIKENLLNIKVTSQSILEAVQTALKNEVTWFTHEVPSTPEKEDAFAVAELTAQILAEAPHPLTREMMELSEQLERDFPALERAKYKQESVVNQARAEKIVVHYSNAKDHKIPYAATLKSDSNLHDEGVKAMNSFSFRRKDRLKKQIDTVLDQLQDQAITYDKIKAGLVGLGLTQAERTGMLRTVLEKRKKDRTSARQLSLGQQRWVEKLLKEVAK